MDAYKDLTEALDPDEQLECIVFGDWGWSGFKENTVFVPKAVRGKRLTPGEARSYMKGWSLDNGYGSPECYALFAWTNKHVYWVTQYDGSTRIDRAPRNPEDCEPYMPGG